MLPVVFTRLRLASAIAVAAVLAALLAVLTAVGSHSQEPVHRPQAAAAVAAPGSVSARSREQVDHLTCRDAAAFEAASSAGPTTAAASPVAQATTSCAPGLDLWWPLAETPLTRPGAAEMDAAASRGPP